MADVVVRIDDPNLGFTMFRPLTVWGRRMLASVVDDEHLLAEGLASWKGLSASVKNDGNHADFVYQSLLIAGVEIGFPSGETMSVSLAELEQSIASLPPDIRSSIRVRGRRPR
jgi:hypothetical protein